MGTAIPSRSIESDSTPSAPPHAESAMSLVGAGSVARTRTDPEPPFARAALPSNQLHASKSEDRPPALTTSSACGRMRRGTSAGRAGAGADGAGRAGTTVGAAAAAAPEGIQIRLSLAGQAPAATGNTVSAARKDER